MGAHSRTSGRHVRPQGRHRGAAAPVVDLDFDFARAGVSAGVLVAAAGTAITLAPTAASASQSVVRTPAAGAVSTADPSAFARLRQCESGGNYATNTGNGFYGAYQFALGTWRGLGYSGLPSQASPAVQDQAAARLQAQRGWSPWPACSVKLGLRNASGSAAALHDPFVPRVPAGAAAPSVRAAGWQPVVPTTPPAFAGTTLERSMVDEQLADVRTWQQRMRDRGWRITVDGYFGPQSASIAAAFAQEKAITSGALGVVDKAMWDAAWQLPVT